MMKIPEFTLYATSRAGMELKDFRYAISATRFADDAPPSYFAPHE
jgi:hypothetical protein